MLALTDLDIPELARRLAAHDCPPSHARRIVRQFYDHHGALDLPGLAVGKRVELLFDQTIVARQSKIVATSISGDGTTKLLIAFSDGGAVESVLMPAHRGDRAAGCVSSQIGCAMGCDFCASTRGGLERSLTTGEILEQFLHLRAAAAKLGRRLNSLVFMGMGEPMLNLPAVLGALRMITSPLAGALGGRHVTVSTVGIVPGIHALADAGLNVHLALSLHAPDDATRAKLVPMNRRYPVEQIMSAAREFQRITNRIVTVEYCLLAGVNDSPTHAERLAALMDGFRAHVNLIPYNPIGAGISGVAYERPTSQSVGAFLTILRDAGIVTHARLQRGDDVNAACGQLRETRAQRLVWPGIAANVG